jgi:alpha-N-arabinofuranosidase
MQKQIDSQHRSAHIAFTEWLFHCCRPNSLPAPGFANMGGAVIAAGFLNMLLSHADIVPISDMTGLMEFAGVWKKREQVYGTPSYYAFQLYSTADIHHVIASDNDAGVYQVHEGIRRLPEIDQVPYLDVVAAMNRSGNRLTLFCVNRHLTDDFTANLSLEKFAATTAHAKVLRGPDIYAVNDEAHPENIKPADQDVTIKAGTLSFTFPHESVTRIEIQR